MRVYVAFLKIGRIFKHETRDPLNNYRASLAEEQENARRSFFAAGFEADSWLTGNGYTGVQRVTVGAPHNAQTIAMATGMNIKFSAPNISHDYFDSDAGAASLAEKGQRLAAKMGENVPGENREY